jgi:SAM-dependent methyltransferase
MDREGWDRRYAGADLVWTADANRFLVEEVSTLAPGRALDLASGEGRNAVWLAERGWAVTAVDFSAVGIDKARRLAAGRAVDSIEWIEADLTDHVPEPGAFDLVVVLYLHLPWPRMAPVLRRAAAALAPGGTFLLVGHDRSNLEQGHGGPQDPAVLYTAESVAAELHGLRIVEAGRRERPVDLPEGGRVVAIDCLVRAERARPGQGIP